MDYKKIQNLLEKYWEGNTSIQEENILQEYFESNMIEKEHLPYQSFFLFRKKERNKKISSDFSIVPKHETVKTIHIRSKKWLAAACIIFISGFFIWTQHNNTEKEKFANVIEINNKEDAYAITLETLRFVSTKLNKGTSKAAEKIDKVKTINRFIKQPKDKNH